MGNLFEQSLSLKNPWYIKDMQFSAEQNRLDFYIDFQRGATFFYEESGIKGEFKAYDTEEKKDCIHSGKQGLRNSERIQGSRNHTRPISCDQTKNGKPKGSVVLFSAHPQYEVKNHHYCISIFVIPKLVK